MHLTVHRINEQRKPEFLHRRSRSNPGTTVTFLARDLSPKAGACRRQERTQRSLSSPVIASRAAERIAAAPAAILRGRCFTAAECHGQCFVISAWVQLHGMELWYCRDCARISRYLQHSCMPMHAPVALHPSCKLSNKGTKSLLTSVSWGGGGTCQIFAMILKSCGGHSRAWPRHATVQHWSFYILPF